MLTGKRVRSAVLAAGIVVAVTFCAHLLVMRPWSLTLGATDEEVRRNMPGDKLLKHPSFNATRAVTIRARPEQIWPWIVQMGYKRAGFYSYDWLDHDGIPSAERIVPEHQNLGRGDLIPLSQDSAVKVEGLVPNRSMVWVFQTQDSLWAGSTWVWGLYEEDRQHTRLVTRLRVRYDWKPSNIVPMLAIDIFEIVMMRKCLLGIQRRAEAESTPELCRLVPVSWYGVKP